MCPFLVVCMTSITGVILTTCIFVFLDPWGQNPLLFSPIDLVVTSAWCGVHSCFTVGCNLLIFLPGEVYDARHGYGSYARCCF